MADRDNNGKYTGGRLVTSHAFIPRVTDGTLDGKQRRSVSFYGISKAEDMTKRDVHYLSKDDIKIMLHGNNKDRIKPDDNPKLRTISSSLDRSKKDRNTITSSLICFIDSLSDYELLRLLATNTSELKSTMEKNESKTTDEKTCPGIAPSIVGDTKIRYYEDDPEATEMAARRRPRRHTADGASHAEVIQKAKQIVANGDPSGQYGTLDRKQLVSILKQRYGNDLEKYNQRGERGVPGSQRAAGVNYQSNGQDLPVEDRYPMGQQRLATSLPRQDAPIHSPREADTGHQYYKISQLHNTQPRVGQSGLSPSLGKKQYRTTTTTTTTVVRKGSDTSHSSSDGNATPAVQTLTRSPGTVPRSPGTLPRSGTVPPQAHPLLFNGHRKSTESMNSDGSLEHHLQKPSPDRILFLQLKDEIKRAAMPRSISSVDTIKALFVTTFPGKLSMPRLDEKGSIYIKDRDAGVFYELDDLNEVRPKSHLKVHERSSSTESYDLSKMQGMPHGAGESPQRPWLGDPNLSPSEYLLRRQAGVKYAESLQDMPIRPKLERSGSGTSLKSDIPISRPAGPVPPSKDVEARTTYRDQNWGVMEETVQAEYVKKGHGSFAAEKSPVVTSSWNSGSSPYTRLQMSSRETESLTFNDVTTVSTITPALRQAAVQATPAAISSPSHSSSTQSKDTLVEVEQQFPVFSTLSHAASKSIPIPMQRKPPPPPPPPPMNQMPQKPPAIPPKKVPPPVQPRNKAREDVRRKLNTELIDVPTSPTTVEEQLADLTELLHTALISDDEDGIKADEEKRPEEEKAPEKPPLPVRQSSRNTSTLTKTNSSSSAQSPLSEKPRKNISLCPSSPSSVTRSIDMVGCALSMKSHVLTLRSQLDEIRNLQANSIKQFKSFIGQAKSDLNGMVDHLNNNAPEGYELPVNFKSRRHQLQNEENVYRHKVEETDEKLQTLEDDTELVRREVIQRKLIVDPSNLDKLGSELQGLGICLADLRAQFSCLHDAMKLVMSGELEIIVQEERFLKEEPGRLDNMLARCKHLSGTIFTLQKLASVQQMSRSGGPEPALAFSTPSTAASGPFYSDTEGDLESDKSVETKQARVVRFKDQSF